jgi:hypothetical protein
MFSRDFLWKHRSEIIVVFVQHGADFLSQMCAHCPQEKLGEAYLLKKKRGRKSNATLAAERAMEAEPAPAAPAAEVKTPKQKRKRAGGPSHQVDQEGWPVRPRALWTLPADLLLSRSTMKTLVRDVSGSDFAEPFLAAVDPEEAPGYAELIKTPMDLGKCCAFLYLAMYRLRTSAVGWMRKRSICDGQSFLWLQAR